MKSAVGYCMHSQSNNTVGPTSEKTEQHIRDAKTYEFWIGPYHVEWKPWVGWVEIIDQTNGMPVVRCWFWKPRLIHIETELWFEGPVRWIKFYWLSLGVSSLRRLPERRKHWRERMGTEYGQRRFDATDRRILDLLEPGEVERRKG
jgi:hypothetical protein